MSKYCPHCNMLTYDDQRCEYCGKSISKVAELKEKAENTKFSPKKIYRKPRHTNHNQTACETCGHEISTKTIQCPSCGEMKFWKLMLLLLKVAIVIGAINLIFYIILFKAVGF